MNEYWIKLYLKWKKANPYEKAMFENHKKNPTFSTSTCGTNQSDEKKTF